MTPAPGAADGRPEITFLCTGNAARSVMATLMFRARTDRFAASGAGTHVIEGHPMSVRTRTALAQLGLADPHHRSRQLRADEARRAALVVAMAPEHVRWVRRHLPDASPRTVTLRRVVRDLAAVGGTDRAGLADRVAGLELANHVPEDWEEVPDPAAGDQDTFHACAAELDRLVARLVGVLDPAGAHQRWSR